MTDTDVLLTRGVDKIYPTPEFLSKKLEEGKPLKVYLGVDPTGELQLHHMVPLRKLRHFQKLGHKVYLLIGSFTAMIGDPTGKTKTRIPLTKEQVLENAKNYAKYARKTLDFENNPPEIVYNGDWLEKLTFKDVIELASHFTVQQMIERDMFQERLKANLPISLHEFMYPLMQGYDSVMLDVDFEVGGTDQTFNMLAGRKLIEQYKGKEKGVLTVNLLTNSDGKKMSTSDGTGVPLNLSSDDMYGKVMSLPDSFLENMFILCTDIDVAEVDKMRTEMSHGANPMIYKKMLAFEIVKIFYSREEAEKAQEQFESTVQGGELPSDIPEKTVDAGSREIVELLVELGLVESKGEGKRLVQQGGVAIIDGEEQRISDPRASIEMKDGLLLRVGKRKYARLKVR